MTGRIFQINCVRRFNTSKGNGDVFLWFNDQNGELTDIRCPSYSLKKAKTMNGQETVREQCKEMGFEDGCIYTETGWIKVPSYEV